MQDVSNAILALSGKLECMIQLQAAPTWGKKKPARWWVELRLQTDEGQVKTTSEHPELLEAVANAWDRLNKLTGQGFDPGAMIPVYDTNLLEHDAD